MLAIDDAHPGRRIAGGYAAWDAARRARRTAPSAKPVRERPAKAPSAGRSASTLRHLIKEAEKELRQLEKQRDRLSAKVADAANDHVQLARIGAELAVVEASVVDAEDRWLELSEEAGWSRAKRDTMGLTSIRPRLRQGQRASWTGGLRLHRWTSRPSPV